jgi:hypothetical protein
VDVGQYVNAGGVRTYYGIYGEGEPLVLLHGGLATAESWATQVPTLAEGYRVYVPERRGHGRAPDLAGPITYGTAQDVMGHFEQQGYEVTETHIPSGGVQVSIRRGGTFKAIIGMKTALNIKIEPQANGSKVEAGVGIFGQQAIPTAITLLVFWPVVIAQVWNMAQEAKLDDEALDVAEESLKAHSSEAATGATAE